MHFANRSALALLLGCLPLAAAIKRSPAVATDYPAAEFKLLPGFVAELVAGPPLIRHPIMAGFDERGRLFVAETTGENLSSKELDARLPNHVTRLVDHDGDGFFDHGTRFADRMTFPQGSLWHEGALYVSSPPGLWRFEDIDDDGVADRREQLTTGFAYTGNAADVHGPFLHPNGRLYWCHGRKGHEVYQSDGETLVSKGKGARIWSCLPDGGDVRVHAGGGMDNPVELVFTPEGEILGPVNLFYGRPRGDVLVHWLHGGVYPRHDMESVVAEFKRTGDLLPEVINFGHVAVSGATRYRSGAFGPDHTGNLFQTFFNTRQIKRVVLTRNAGGTFNAESHDFLDCSSPDVHFTDVLEDADGSLLVIDTGGWFRIGCPTSQIAKPEAAGAIYRIRREDTPHIRDPRGLGIAWQELSAKDLSKFLADPRVAVRDRAGETMMKRDADESTRELATILSAENLSARVLAANLLGRINTPESRAALRRELELPRTPARVQQTIARVLGELRDRAAARVMTGLLSANDTALRRVAITALGQIGDASAIQSLGAQLKNDTSPELRHAVIYALIEINEADAIRRQLNDVTHPLQRAGLLIAADQMESAPLTAGDVIPHLATADEDLFKAVSFVSTSKPAWAEAFVAEFRKWFQAGPPDPLRARALRRILPGLLATPAARELVGTLLAGDDARYGFGCEIITAAPDPGLESSWILPLRNALTGPVEARISAALDALKTIRSPTFDADLRKLGADTDQAPLLRVKALSAVSVRNGTLDSAAFQLLLDILDRKSSPRQTTEATGLLANARLNSAQLRQLAPALARLGPLALPAAVLPFERNRTSEVGLALVAALRDAPGLGAIPPAELQRVITRYPPPVMIAAGPWLKPLLAADENRAQRLEETDRRLGKGDAARGKQIFESATSLCHVCHRINGNGGQVGPDLSKIGAIRNRRDLLEAILYPSASLARDAEAHVIELSDGESQTGVIHSETPERIRLAIANGTLMEIPRSRIRTIRPSALSLMPAGLEQTMTGPQLADLIAYLGGLR